MNKEIKQCQNCKIDFTIESEDFDFYDKIKVPPPTWCVQCRAIRRSAFRCHSRLYKRQCQAPEHNEIIISTWPENSGIKIYDNEYWHSDKWNPLDYGKEYDFNKPFFIQLKELLHNVPFMAQDQINMENSPYSRGGWSKNCYLCFNTGYTEDSAYSVTLQKSKQCYDVDTVEESELCYYSFNLIKCYRTFYSNNCHECVDLWFSKNCVGCSNCFRCVGLRNKSYYFFNKQYSKEEYTKSLNAYIDGSRDGIKKAKQKSSKLWSRYPNKYANIKNADNVSGDYIHNASNVRNSFIVGNAKNIAYAQNVVYGPTNDSMDINAVGINSELLYETMESGMNSNNLKFCWWSLENYNLDYSINCRNSYDLFGCVGLRNASFSIFNRQYSKKEYNSLLPKIKQHMNDMPYIDAKKREYRYGEFYPIEFSPYEINDTFAIKFYDIDKEKAELWGYRWKNISKSKYKPTIEATALPENIKNVTQDILKEIIQCTHKTKCNDNCIYVFQVIEKELAFYKQMNLPLPILCFNCRNADITRTRNYLRLYKRKCDCVGHGSKIKEHGASELASSGLGPKYKYTNLSVNHLSHSSDQPCPNEFETSYLPNSKEIVYCEGCYQQEVV